MGETTDIKVEHLRRGQPGPYQPHVYESRITITGSRTWNRLTVEQVRALARVVVHPWTDDPPDGSMAGHFKPRLRRLERVSEEHLSDHPLGPRREVWMVRVEEPFTD